MRVASVEQMREMDRRASEEYGIPELLLMENAALAAVRVLESEPRLAGGRRFAVVAGPGNNGGDALAVARLLHSRGRRVTVLALADPEKYRGAAADNRRAVEALGLEVVRDPGREALDAAFAGADVAVDGLLGTGLTRDVEGPFRQAVEALNAAPAPVLALDIPSGVDGDGGRVRGVAVEAAATVTFGLPKLGNLLFPGAAHAGRLWVTHISFPPELWDDPGLPVGLNRPEPLPARRPDGHKGSFGDVLTVGGGGGYFGAPGFAGLAVLRTGAGYSRLAAPRGICAAVATRAPELVFVPQRETADGNLALANLDDLLELAGEVDAVVVGPGLSLDAESQELARRLVAGIDRPLLLDGDGLTALAARPRWLKRREAATVLTPHPGEMSRLLDRPIGEITDDPLAAAREAADELGATVVLKGAHSLVAEPGGRVAINPTGSSAMATAGSGDVLSGAVAALLALGLEPPAATRLGVFLHGLAGEAAAAELGADGVVAGDLVDRLPQVVRRWREQREAILAGPEGGLAGVV